jgi:hypothetical protein
LVTEVVDSSLTRYKDGINILEFGSDLSGGKVILSHMLKYAKRFFFWYLPAT